MSNEALKKVADIEGKAKVLQDTSYGNWSSKRGTTVYINAIVSKMAYKESEDGQD